MVIMSSSEELAQLNLRMHGETVGHLRTLARVDGKKLHPYLIGVLQSAVDEQLLAQGRGAFMAELDAEQAAERAMYEAKFDELEAK